MTLMAKALHTDLPPCLLRYLRQTFVQSGGSLNSQTSCHSYFHDKVAKFYPKVSSRRTTKIEILVIVIIILVAIILWHYQYQ